MVLVVDDDRDQLSLRSILVRRAGFDVIEASNQQAAIAEARKQKPRCAIVDLGMPAEEDGLLLIRLLKENDPAIHILVLTGTTLDRIKAKPEASLVDCFLQKPAASRDLIAAVRDSLAPTED